MKVLGQQNPLKHQLSQAIRAAMQLSPDVNAGSAEVEALMKEFTEVMDKIAAKLKESTPKGKLSEFNDFGVGELEHVLAMTAPKFKPIEENKPEFKKPEEKDNAVVIKEPTQKIESCKAKPVDSEDKQEVTPEKPTVQKNTSEAPIKVSGNANENDKVDSSEKVVRELIQEVVNQPEGVIQHVTKPATESSPAAIEPVETEAQPLIPAEQKVAPAEVKVPVKGEEIKVSEKAVEAKAPESKVSVQLENQEVKVEQIAIAEPVPQPATVKEEVDSVQVQAQTKLAAVLSAELSRVRSDVSFLRMAVEHERSVSSVSKQVTETAVKANTQVNSASAMNSFSASDGGFTKPLESLARNEVARSARTLSQQASSRTTEKVENALKEAAKSRDGKTISLRLDPPELGSVKVDVSMRDGNLHARIVAESPAVSQLLREKAHDLQSVLRKLGLHADSVSVSVSNSEDRAQSQQSFSQQEKMRDHGFFGEVSRFVDLPKASESSAVVTDHWVA